MSDVFSKGNVALLALVIAISGVILVGEYAAYGGIYRYDAGADDAGNFMISDSGSHKYSAVLTDNGMFEAPDKFYLYYDETYGSVVHDVVVEIGAKALTQDYYLAQLVNNLKYYSITDVSYVDAAGLSALLADTSTAPKAGLVVLSGALPSNVYSGSDSDPIFSWISAGGTLYWAGESVGRYIGNADGSVTETSGYDLLFTGVSGSLNATDGSGRAYSEITSNRYSVDLSLKNNEVKYAVNPSMLSCENLAVGYTEDGYASTCFFRHGDGQICIMGGDYSNNQRMDLANLMASGICYGSVEIDYKEGIVARGTVNGTFDGFPASHGKMAVFLYLGGDFSVYGKTIFIAEA